MYPTMGFTHCKVRKHTVNIILNLNKYRSLGTRGEGFYIYSYLSIVLLACSNFSCYLNFWGSTIWILLLPDAPIEVNAWNDRQLTRFYGKAMFGLIFGKKQVCAPCFHSRLDQLLGCVFLMFNVFIQRSVGGVVDLGCVSPWFWIWESNSRCRFSSKRKQQFLS